MSFDIGRISIVIPVRDAAEYIAAMLDDISSQTYKNVETIVVYDTESTDATLDILIAYAKNHPLRIEVGKGYSVGFARNRGADLATGDFIIFLDADDRIIPEYLSDLAQVFVHRPDLDIVFGEYIAAKSSEVTETYLQAERSPAGISYHQNTEILEMWCTGRLGGFSWRWLVRREYFVGHDIRYPDYSRMEDDSYVLQLITNTTMIGHSRKQGYVYIQHPSSLSHVLPPLYRRIMDYKRHNADVSRILSKTYPHYLSLFKRNMGNVVWDKLKERVRGADTSESLMK